MSGTDCSCCGSSPCRWDLPDSGGIWQRCELCDGKGWIANRDGGLADPPSLRCPRCDRTGFEPRYRCTGCGEEWDLEDLQQIFPDGHNACPSADHEAAGEDPPLDRIFKAAEDSA